jgi:hypothetical protein
VENYTNDILVAMISQSCDVIGERYFGEPADKPSQDMNTIEGIPYLTKLRIRIARNPWI